MLRSVRRATRTSAAALVLALAAVGLTATASSAAETTWSEDGLSVSLAYSSYTDVNTNGVPDAGDRFSFTLSITDDVERSVAMTLGILNATSASASSSPEATPGNPGTVTVTVGMPAGADPATWAPLFYLRLTKTRGGEDTTVQTANLSTQPETLTYAAWRLTKLAWAVETYGNTSDGLAMVGDKVRGAVMVEIFGTASWSSATIQIAGSSATWTNSLGPYISFNMGESVTVTRADVMRGYVDVPYSVKGVVRYGLPALTESGTLNRVYTVSPNLGAAFSGTPEFHDGTSGDVVTWPEVGDTLSFTGATITNTSNVDYDALTVASPGVGGCSAASTVDDRSTVTAPCSWTPYTITLADLERGYVDIPWSGSEALIAGSWYDLPTPTTRVTLDDATASFSFDATGVLNDLNGDGIANQGETIDYEMTTINTGPYSRDDLALHLSDAGDLSLAGAFADGTLLAPRATDVFAQQYTVTADDEARGTIAYTPTMAPTLAGHTIAPISAAPIVITAGHFTPSEADLLLRGRRAVTAPATLHPGDTFTAQVSGADGEMYEFYYMSTPVAAGVHTVGTAGAVTLTLPADIPLGTHHLAVYTPGGVYVGAAEFEVVAEPVPEPADTTDDTEDTEDTEELSGTGPEDAARSLGLAAALVLLGSVTLIGSRRFRRD